MKRPAFQFYPSDWRSDNGLQSCSLEAQGLWINMMCLMHESEKYGFLMIFPKNLDENSKNFKENLQKSYEKVLGKFFGLTSGRVRKLLEELESFSVFSRDEFGVIYSRRMVKDHNLSEKRAASGSLGGNPNLVNQNSSKPQANQEANSNQGSKQKVTPSSSTSSSTSFKEKNTTYSKEKFNVDKPEDVSETLWIDFVKHRKLKRAAITDRVISTIRHEALKANLTIEQAIDTMIARGWTGFEAEWVTKTNQQTTPKNKINQSFDQMNYESGKL